MQRIRILALTFGGWLASVVCGTADTVTQPDRTYGLGDLLQVAVSPNRQWMASAGSGGAVIWNFTNGTVLHRLEAHSGRVMALSLSQREKVEDGVANGTRTRNIQNHNLGLYH